MIDLPQLPLALPVRPAHGRDNFFVSGSNATALAMVESWPRWPGNKLLLLGPTGAGKTHLTSVWVERSAARVVAAQGLADTDIAALVMHGTVAVEGVDFLADGGHVDDEHALFHLHNMILAEGGSLLMTARSAPTTWRLATPDLASRIAGTSAIEVGPPDDALLSAVLIKLFADRQIDISPRLIAYLLPRMERSLAGIGALVDRLDRAALAAKRPLTVPFAAKVLETSR